MLQSASTAAGAAPQAQRYPTPSPVPERSNLLMSSASYADCPSTFSPAAAARNNRRGGVPSMANYSQLDASCQEASR